MAINFTNAIQWILCSNVLTTKGAFTSRFSPRGEMHPGDEFTPVFEQSPYSIHMFQPGWNLTPGWLHPGLEDRDEISPRGENAKNYHVNRNKFHPGILKVFFYYSKFHSNVLIFFICSKFYYNFIIEKMADKQKTAKFRQQ